MVNELINAETDYHSVIGRSIVNINQALKMNERYYDKLFDLYKKTDNPEDKIELRYELRYLVEQAELLRDIQIIQTGGNF